LQSARSCRKCKKNGEKASNIGEDVLFLLFKTKITHECTLHLFCCQGDSSYTHPHLPHALHRLEAAERARRMKKRLVTMVEICFVYFITVVLCCQLDSSFPTFTPSS
jgi:hypothetical protein